MDNMATKVALLASMVVGTCAYLTNDDEILHSAAIFSVLVGVSFVIRRKISIRREEK